MLLKDYVRNSLVSLGLSEGEIAVYLTLFKRPGLSVGELVKKTRLSVPGVYKILDSLMNKCLVEIVEKVKPSLFKTTDLSFLSRYIEKKAVQWQRMSKHMTLLSRMPEVSKETEVFSDGEMADFYLGVLKKVPDFLVFMGTYDSILNVPGKELEYAFVKDRVRRGIPTNGIMFERSPLTDELEKRNWREKREFCYFEIPNYPREFTYVYGDHVANFFQDEQGKSQVIHVHSRPLARARLLQMQSLWNSTRE